MKIKKMILAFLVFAAFGVGMLSGEIKRMMGSIDSPAGPMESASQMYTLNQIYDRLTTGAAQTKMTQFAEPGSGPASTMHTLNELYDAINGNCITCDGTMIGTRWCDNGDGTVTDLTTGLVWLQKADWGGLKAWRVDAVSSHDDAHTRAGTLSAADATSGLSDGSELGDWRLPTKSDLYGLANGAEAVSNSNMRAFTGVQDYSYWSSTTAADNANYAWYVSMNNNNMYSANKTAPFHV